MRQETNLNSVGWFKLLTRYEPYSYQARILLDESPIVLIKAGRQVGKSEVISVVGFLHAALNPNSLVFITAATYRQANIIYDKIEGILLRHRQLWGLVVSKNSEELTLDNGSRIMIVPSAEGITIRGFTPTLIIVDEAAYVKDQVFLALDPMMLHGARLMMVTSPFGKRGKFWDMWNSADPSISKHAITVFDCLEEIGDPAKAVLMRRHIERERESKTQNEFAQEYLGEFVADEDTYFSRELILNCVANVVEHHQKEKDVRYWLGVDLARYGVDESVYVVGADIGGVFTIVHMEATSKKPLTDSIGRTQALHEAFKFRKIFMDESGLGGGSIDMLKEKGLPIEPITFTLGNKEELYKNLKLLMEQGKVKFPDNKRLMEQMANMEYEYTSTRQMKIHHPEGGFDDWVDACALAAFGMRSKPFIFSFGDEIVSK